MIYLAIIWPLIFLSILVCIYLYRIHKLIKSYFYTLTQVYNIIKKDQWEIQNQLTTINTQNINMANNIKKGNKDQQEIKTKLTNLRQLVEKTSKK